MSQGQLHLQLKMKELEMWKVELLRVKAPLPVGQALYIVWSEENKRGKSKRHPFQGDIRIVRKVKGENRNTIFAFKDGKTMTIPTAHLPRHITTSNTLLASPLDKIVLGKKMAHAEEHCTLASDDESNEEEDGEDEEDDEEDGEDEDNEEENAENVIPMTLGGGENASTGEQGTETTDPKRHTTLTGDVTTGESDTAATTLGGGEKASTGDKGTETTDPKSPMTVTGALAEGESETAATTCGDSEKAGATHPISQTTLTGAVAAGEPNSHGSRSLYNPPPPPEMSGTPLPSHDNAAMEGSAIEMKMRELREAQAKVKAAKKFMTAWKKDVVGKSTHRAKKIRLEEELKKVKLEVKMETAATKLQAQESRNKRKRMNDMDSDDDSASDGNDISDKPRKRVLTTIDKWQQGHRRAALSAARNKLIEKVTVGSWAEAKIMMEDYGFAVVDNFVELFSNESKPTLEQRDYIYQCTLIPTIFTFIIPIYV